MRCCGQGEVVVKETETRMATREVTHGEGYAWGVEREGGNSKWVAATRVAARA